MTNKLFNTFLIMGIAPLGQLVWLPEPYDVLGCIGLGLQMVGLIGAIVTGLKILK
jgi:hypothetical protein